MLGITKSELWVIRRALETGEEVGDALDIVESTIQKGVEVSPALTYEDQFGISEDDLALVQTGEYE